MWSRQISCIQHYNGRRGNHLFSCLPYPDDAAASQVPLRCRKADFRGDHPIPPGYPLLFRDSVLSTDVSIGGILLRPIIDMIGWSRHKYCCKVLGRHRPRRFPASNSYPDANIDDVPPLLKEWAPYGSVHRFSFVSQNR